MVYEELIRIASILARFHGQCQSPAISVTFRLQQNALEMKLPLPVPLVQQAPGGAMVEHAGDSEPD